MLKEFIKNNKNLWSQMPEHKKEMTQTAFNDNPNNVVDFINNNATIWSQMDTGKMMESLIAFRENNPNVVDFISNNPKEWLKLDDNQIAITKRAFESGNDNLINFINNNPKEWATTELFSMRMTSNLFVNTLNDLTHITNFIIKNPKNWLRMPSDKMVTTLRAFNTNIGNIVDFINNKPEFWTEIDHNKMENIVQNFNNPVRRYEFMWQRDNFKTPKDILLNSDALFADNLLMTNPSKFSAETIETDIIPATNKAKKMGLSNSQIYAHPMTLENLYNMRNLDIRHINNPTARQKLDYAFNTISKASRFKIDLFKKEHTKTAEDISNKIHLPVSVVINSFLPMLGANDIKKLTKTISQTKISPKVSLKRNAISSDNLLTHVNKKTRLFHYA